MNILLLRWSVRAFVVGTLTLLLAGCFVPSGGIGYDEGVGVGAAYYEPYGVEYGGWGAEYRVAPFRGGGHRPTSGDSHVTHAYRSAPASRSMPSLPSHGGGGRGGGVHGGGGRR